MVTWSALRSPLGFIKFVLIGIIASIIVISYCGNEGNRLFFGKQDYLGVGVSVGFAVILPILIVAYIFDGSIFVLESVLSLAGGALFLTVGLLTLSAYSHPELGAPAGKALAGLCISSGAVFIVNFFTVLCTMRK